MRKVNKLTLEERPTQFLKIQRIIENTANYLGQTIQEWTK